MSLRNYVVILLAVFIGLTASDQLYVKAARLACWSGGYRRDAWMAYCNSEKYGVYDVDAIWFGTEPEVPASIAKAQILTLSDSRLQNALSLGGAGDWMSAHRVSAYLLGLPTAESGFGAMLWDKFKPHPNILIFDTSPYFTGGLGGSEKTIIEDSANRQAQVVELRDFQSDHQRYCTKLSWLCGQNFAYFRSRIDGHWIFPDADSRPLLGSGSVPNDQTRFPVETTPTENAPLYPEYLQAAKSLIEKTGLPPRCIVITHVPNQDSMRGLAKYLGDSLGATVIEPEVPDLYTFDHWHLTPSSSRRWTQAFLRELEPLLQSCIPRA